jgi:pimeloyl-ACP methyl ester carboxylesterase
MNGNLEHADASLLDLQTGLRASYLDCGDRTQPVVLLLHGYTDSWRSFRLIIRLLASRYRCLALDQRGHGGTPYQGNDYSLGSFAEDVVAFLRHPAVAVARVTLIGHSMGSFVARRVALLAPALVERLVLVGSGLVAGPENPAIKELWAAVGNLHGPVDRTFVEQFQAGCVYCPDLLPPRFFNDCVAASQAVRPEVWRGALSGLMADDHTALLGSIHQPTLVIGGEHDAVFSWREQEELARRFPRGRRPVLYRYAGHSPHWEQPGRFVEDVESFVG